MPLQSVPKQEGNFYFSTKITDLRKPSAKCTGPIHVDESRVTSELDSDNQKFSLSVIVAPTKDTFVPISRLQSFVNDATKVPKEPTAEMMIFRCVRSQHDIRCGCVNLRLALQLENRPFVLNATRTGNLGINSLDGPSISTEERYRRRYKIGTAIVDLITQFDLAPKFGDHAFLA